MMRRKNTGFKLGRKIIKIFKWARFNTSPCKYNKLPGSTTRNNKTISKLCKWGKKIKQGLLNSGSTRGYIRVGDEPVTVNKPVHVPRGHLAIHVGGIDGETTRVLVPVLFLNHPLFEKLLKEAEDVYGFDYSGRITVPCPMSEFESVKSRIKATGSKCRFSIPSLFLSRKCLNAPMT